MMAIRKPYKELFAEVEDLRSRLQEAQSTLNAIRSGEVDAVVVSAPEGERVFTLKGAEYPYRIFVEFMAEGAATLTAEGSILYGNNRLAAMLGTPLEKLMGTFLNTYIVPADALVFSAALETGVKKSGVVEVTLLKGKKETIPVLLSYCPVKFEGIKAINMIITDLSERKRNEEIVASERLANSILEQAGETIIVCDETGRIIRANRLAHQLSHGNPLFHSMDEALLFKISKTGKFFSILDTLKGQAFRSLEVTLQGKEGQTIYLLLNATPLRDSQDQVIGCVIILADMSERKQAEKDLLESEAKHRRLFESNIIGVKYATQERIVEANEALLKILGYTEKDLKAGRITWGKILPLNSPSDFRTRMYRQELLEKGQLAPIEKEYIRKDGNRVHVLVGTALLKKDPFMWVSFVVDITKRKQMENELRQIREELEERVAQRTKELAHTVDALRTEIEERKKLEQQLLQAQKMESIGMLAGGVAHSFNNMLTVISGFGQILKKKIPPTDTQAKDSVEQILKATGQAAELTNSLLVFSRKQVMDSKAADLNVLIRNAAKLIEKLISEDIEFYTSLFPDPLPVMADIGQMTQVLVNLATNARDAMPRGGILTITTEKTEIKKGSEEQYSLELPGLYGLITIKDTGEGIPEKLLNKIFEPFYTTKEIGKGTGLGLPIAYGIIKQHAGAITVESQLNKGTTFRIYLPLIVGAAFAEQPEALLPKMEGTGKILLAEDEEMVRDFIRIILEESGYQIILASDGDEALEQFKKHPNIDLLITDVVMPKKNGKQIFEQIRSLNPKTKAIFISGYTADILNEKGGQKGEEIIFLTKPFTTESLLTKVWEVLHECQKA